ncbi:Bro-N domain-containing protein [Glycomyces sp. NPDC048151]|uniref:BRO-N domain-containing protein n=1 Tax=Glycomyces sp. NPDC048151 TaxID=3364002 RepID=UPI0037162514
MSNEEFKLQIIYEGQSFKVPSAALATALGFSRHRDMIRMLPEQHQTTAIIATPGGTQQVAAVTEPGFYRLISQRLASRIADADLRAMVERFQEWVFDEVLPGLRRSGAYVLYNEAATETPTLTFAELAALLRVRCGWEWGRAELMRQLRTAGVLCQTGQPRRSWEHCFYFTGSAWTVFEHAVEAIEQHLNQVQGVLRKDRVALEGVAADAIAA